MKVDSLAQRTKTCRYSCWIELLFALGMEAISRAGSLCASVINSLNCGRLMPLPMR